MAENVKQAKTVKEPLFHIVKKNAMPLWQRILIKAGGLLLGFLISGLLVTALTGQSPLKLYKSLFEGNFGQEIRVWKMLQETALLLGIGLALLPAFKMKFWNIGAEGQVLVGGVATAGFMIYLGSDPVGYFALDLTPTGAMCLSRLFLLEKARGQGIGRSIVAYAQKLAEGDGRSRLYLRVWAKDLKAEGFCKKCRFRKSETVPMEVLPGVTLDITTWEKLWR